MSFIRDGMVVGLGTGSTAEQFMRALAEAIRAGRLHNIVGIATSAQSQRLASELQIPLSDLARHPRADITVDGTDEVDPQLNLIKGLGGALLREKIVAQNSAVQIIIADAGKRVAKLGTRSPLPVEVTPFGHESHEAFFRKLGARPVLRRQSDAKPFVTDNGNYIYDCRFDGIDDPAAMENRLLHRAGVVETGLFVNLAQIALIADDNSVQEMRR